MLSNFYKMVLLYKYEFNYLMKFIIICNSQQVELDIEEPTIELLKNTIKDKLNVSL